MLKQQYRLSVQVHDWPISTEPGKWMAEIPALPGCRAWGDTPDEAIDIISDLAVGFIRDGITENTLPSMVNPVEARESTTVYFLTSDRQQEYTANCISSTAVELTVSV